MLASFVTFEQETDRLTVAEKLRALLRCFNNKQAVDSVREHTGMITKNGTTTFDPICKHSFDDLEKLAESGEKWVVGTVFDLLKREAGCEPSQEESVMRSLLQNLGELMTDVTIFSTTVMNHIKTGFRVVNSRVKGSAHPEIRGIINDTTYWRDVANAAPKELKNWYDSEYQRTGDVCRSADEFLEVLQSWISRKCVVDATDKEELQRRAGKNASATDTFFINTVSTMTESGQMVLKTVPKPPAVNPKTSTNAATSGGGGDGGSGAGGDADAKNE